MAFKTWDLEPEALDIAERPVSDCAIQHDMRLHEKLTKLKSGVETCHGVQLKTQFHKCDEFVEMKPGWSQKRGLSSGHFLEIEQD